MSQQDTEDGVVVPRAQLDDWARSCQDVYGDLTLVEGRLVHNQDLYAARQFLHPAREEAWHLLQSLIRAGAERPTPATSPGTVPLALLSTPAARRVAELLCETVTAAEAVLEERGGPEHADAATRARTERLRLLLAEVTAEVYGPAGRDGLQ